MRHTTIYPVEGRLILMPDRGFQPVPAEGAPVIVDQFYARALLDGDVTEKPPAQPELPLAQAKTAAANVATSAPATGATDSK